MGVAVAVRFTTPTKADLKKAQYSNPHRMSAIYYICYAARTTPQQRSRWQDQSPAGGPVVSPGPGF